jgi:nucleoside-diphosphate-sugar epimerase
VTGFFVTGATGFIGSAVARLLDTRGLAVSVLARATSPRGNLKDLKCEVALGDMTDAAAMNRALNGVRYLFHVAADCRLWAPDRSERSEIVRTNREGTRVVMRAASAKKAGGWFFVQDVVLQLGETAIDFPPMQKPASFSLTRVGANNRN